MATSMGDTNDLICMGSMGMVYLPAWMVDFYGKCGWDIPYMDRMGYWCTSFGQLIYHFTFIHLKQIFGTEMYNILAINAGILWPIDLWKMWEHYLFSFDLYRRQGDMLYSERERWFVAFQSWFPLSLKKFPIYGSSQRKPRPTWKFPEELKNIVLQSDKEFARFLLTHIDTLFTINCYKFHSPWKHRRFLRSSLDLLALESSTECLCRKL